MSTGPEHYQAAEACIDLVDDESLSSLVMLAEAQVHATLALAAANASALWVMSQDDVEADAKQWREIIGLGIAAEHQAVKAEPLVMCGDRSDNGMYTCILPVDHEGCHTDHNPMGVSVMWAQDDPGDEEPKSLPNCFARRADGQTCVLPYGHEPGNFHQDDEGYTFVLNQMTAEVS